MNAAQQTTDSPSRRFTESGGTTVETAMLLSLISVIALASLRGVGVSSTETFQNANREVENATFSTTPINEQSASGVIKVALRPAATASKIGKRSGFGD